VARHQQHQGHNKEGTPITDGTRAPASAHPEQQGHQKSAEIIETPTAIRNSTSAGSTATAKTPTLAKLQLTDRCRNDKKENQFFLIYKEIQRGAVSKLYTRKGFLIYCMRKCAQMRRPLVI
jgi:hypothetical protein